ncbi:MAG: hypothetical protein R3C12_11715 [Planctomycetaceae bacterium]
MVSQASEYREKVAGVTGPHSPRPTLRLAGYPVWRALGNKSAWRGALACRPFMVAAIAMESDDGGCSGNHA